MKSYYDFRIEYSRITGKPFTYKNSIQNLKLDLKTLVNKNINHYILWKDENVNGYFSLKPVTLNICNEEKKIYKLTSNIIGGVSNKEVFAVIQKTLIGKSEYLIINCSGQENEFIEKEFNSIVLEELERYYIDMSIANEKNILNCKLLGNQIFSNYTLKFCTNVPSSLVNEYSDVYTKILKSIDSLSLSFDWNIPTVKGIREREERYRKKNHGFFQYLLFDESNKMIGMTFVEYDKNKPQKVIQNMTGVLKNYRRKGLGKWLKASMYLELKKKINDLKIIESKVHHNNIAMKHLNKQLGYKKIEVIIEHLIKLSDFKMSKSYQQE